MLQRNCSLIALLGAVCDACRALEPQHTAGSLFALGRTSRRGWTRRTATIQATNLSANNVDTAADCSVRHTSGKPFQALTV